MSHPDGGGSRVYWESVHARREDEVSWFQASPTTSLQLVARTGAPRGARILDVGGGASRLVDGLLDAGFDRVTVLDIAGVALARARCRLGPRATAVAWVEADVTAWVPEAPFDVWHDRAVFHFLVRPEDRAAYRTALLAALRGGGQAIIATFASDGPERCTGLPVVRYEPAALAAELGPDFTLVESLHEDHRTPGGKLQRFQWSRLVRR
jgi:SAM-dependent methyltransferase